MSNSAKPKLHLKQEYIDELQHILNAYVKDSTVWAYGSRVNGDSHEGSDLDLVLINSQDNSIRQPAIWDLKEALSESNLPFLVDVLDWATIPESFREEIKQCYIKIK